MFHDDELVTALNRLIFPDLRLHPPPFSRFTQANQFHVPPTHAHWDLTLIDQFACGALLNSHYQAFILLRKRADWVRRIGCVRHRFLKNTSHDGACAQPANMSFSFTPVSPSYSKPVGSSPRFRL